jgi:hypothetical protein
MSRLRLENDRGTGSTRQGKEGWLMGGHRFKRWSLVLSAVLVVVVAGTVIGFRLENLEARRAE